MTLFRAISLVAIMGALVLLYLVHPVAGWTTLTVMGGMVVLGRRRARAGGA